MAPARPAVSNKPQRNALSRTQPISVAQTNLNPDPKASTNFNKVHAHEQPVPKRCKIDPASHASKARQSTTTGTNDTRGKASMAAKFMREVKTALSAKQMSIFKSALRDFKLYRSHRGQHSIDIAKQWSGTQQVIHDLFAKVPNGDQLRRGFTKFTQRLKPVKSSLQHKISHSKTVR